MILEDDIERVVRRERADGRAGSGGRAACHLEVTSPSGSSEKCGRTTLERKDGRWGSVTRAASVVRIGEQVKNTQDKRLKPKFSLQGWGNNIYEERSVNTDEWSFTVATCLVSLCKCDHTQINDPKCSVTSVTRIVDPCTHWCSTDAEKYGHGLKIHSVKQSLCQGLTQGTSSKFKVWCVVHVCTGTQSSCVNDERNMLFGAYCNIFALESSDAGQWLRWRFKSHARLPTKVIPQF